MSSTEAEYSLTSKSCYTGKTATFSTSTN